MSSTAPTTSSAADESSAELRLLDARGCLTAEAMCFFDELDSDQRAVVQRHVGSCALCAQQQANLARAAQRIRRSRPSLQVPADARIAARQAILRSLVLQRERARTPRARAIAVRRRPGRRVRPRWLPLLVALAFASAALATLLLLR